MINSTGLNRRAFLRRTGATLALAPFITRNLLAQSPNGMVRHASFGASNQALSDINELTKAKELQLVAVAEVDLNRTAEIKKRFPDTRIYQDWRQLLEKEDKNIDSVNVSVPDHMHAPIAMTALRMGKHVYGQKPLAHDIYEVRKLTEFSRGKSLITQMGIQIHSVSAYRLAVKLIQDGVIGKVKETHSWCPKSWGDPEPRPETTDPVPQGLDWNIWLGGCEDRPYIGNEYYHPVNWRKRLDFGTGTLGDMGCHIFDPIFTSLGLTAPLSVRSEGPAPNKTNWAIDSLVHYVFPGTPRTADKTLSATWYDGAQKLPKEVLALLEGDEQPNTGSIFVGTEGTMVLPHINRPILYPDKKFKDFKYPQVPNGDHYREFVEACDGQGQTSAPFSYAGPLTEAVLLGTIASRFPKTTMKWDSAKMRLSESAANAYLRRSYRKGWSVKGLG
jgi:predicted dehydrogenase